jgi:hypothetical protein
MAITVLTTPTIVVNSSAEDHIWQVRNNGAGVISLGRISTLTVASGFSVASGLTLAVDVKEGEQLFAITATTATVDVI